MTLLSRSVIKSTELWGSVSKDSDPHKFRRVILDLFTSSYSGRLIGCDSNYYDRNKHMIYNHYFLIL